MLKYFSVDRWKAQSLLITSVINILVLQRFRVVYREIFHESLAFSRHTINATYAQHKMGRLSNRRISSNKQRLFYVLISCFFLLHDIKYAEPPRRNKTCIRKKAREKCVSQLAVCFQSFIPDWSKNGGIFVVIA